MYELWARRRTDNKDEYITSFNESWQFDFMLDQVDEEEYKEACILELRDHTKALVRYREFKEFKPMVRKKRNEHGKNNI